MVEERSGCAWIDCEPEWDNFRQAGGGFKGFGIKWMKIWPFDFSRAGGSGRPRRPARPGRRGGLGDPRMVADGGAEHLWVFPKNAGDCQWIIGA